MKIRDEEPADLAALHEVVEAAFQRRDEADLVDKLRTDGDVVISLVALNRDELVGHVLFSKMVAPFSALGLAPVAVKPNWQRSGIGAKLIHAGLTRAKEKGWQGVFVLGAPSYYRGFGFDPALASGFTSPYSGPYLMALALGADLPATKGTIEYAPAFRSLA
jgi:putative acetyltransferase